METVGAEVEIASPPPAPVASPAPVHVPRPAAGAKERRQAATRRRDAIFRRSLILADMIASSVALVLATRLSGDGLTLAALLVPPIIVLAAKAIGLYDQDEHRLHKTTLDEVPSLFTLAVLAATALYLVGGPVYSEPPARQETIALLGFMFLLSVSGRALARFLARSATSPERCLLIGNSSRQHLLEDALAMSPATHAAIVGVVPMFAQRDTDLHLPAPATELIDQLMVDRVIVLSGSQTRDELMFAIREFRDAGAKVSILPDVSRLAGMSVELDSVGGMTLLGMRRFSMSRSSRAIKRGFDLVLASGLLLASAPLLTAVGIAIRLDSPGPVLFRQRRIGRYGRHFKIYKLRSMHLGAHDQRDELRELNSAAPGLFKITDDPRTTRVGRFVRRTNIDELPQLLNVIRGDMSLVGPRPLIPEEDKQVVGAYRDRLDVRPGITGHWQILGAARVSLAEMVKLDYLYVANWSLWNDIVLLLRTFPVVFHRRGQ